MRSLIWEHFTVSVNDDSKAICNYCNALISRGKEPEDIWNNKLAKTFEAEPYIEVQQFGTR